MTTRVDVLVIGAGAAGMMCAAEAGLRGRSVQVVDHARAPGEKIRISGGGRCNFTNRRPRADAFLGENPRFAASALSRYGAEDFIALVDARGIAWHEKDNGGRRLGQLFCDGSSRQIVGMLTDRMASAGVRLDLGVAVAALERTGEGFTATLGDGRSLACSSVVVATGGKSIPKMGASGWAYDVARRFGLRVTPTRPALVPLTFDPDWLQTLRPLAGVSVDAVVEARPGDDRRRAARARFDEAVLFTHRGLSGPAVLQASSYWREGEDVVFDLAPGHAVGDRLRRAKRDHPQRLVSTALGDVLPRRLAEVWCLRLGTLGRLGDTSDKALAALGEATNAWRARPVGSEGYRTAEVTLGGVDTADLDQRSMQARAVPSLFFVGEAVDITGWLGGYNFQWAWSSGWAAGQVC